MDRKEKSFKFLEVLLLNLKKADLTDKASSLAYYLLLSIFPFMIFFLNTLSMFFKGRKSLLLNLLDVLPDSAGEILKELVISLLESSSGTLLSISLLVAVWTGSKGIAKLIGAINETYGIKRGNLFLDRIYSVFFTLAFALILFLVFVSMVFGDLISSLLIKSIGSTNVFFRIWLFLKDTVPSIFMVSIFSLLYKYTLREGMVRKVKFTYAFLGALFTSAVWTLVTKGFSFYVNNFGRFDKTYGSIGGVIILIIWLYISSIIMILGSYVTKSLVDIDIF